MDSRRPTGILKVVGLATWLACIGGVPAHATAGENQTPIVETDKGKVQGYIRNGVLEFRSIPFGAPVGGERRWTLPEPAEPWTGVLQAMHFKPACAQAARYNLTERSDNEDCLHLNVSLPYSGEELSGQKRPVIVWIHGGAFGFCRKPFVSEFQLSRWRFR